MKKMLGIFRLPELYCALLLAASLVVGFALRVSVENVVLRQGPSMENVSLPVTKKMREGEMFQVELDIKNAYRTSYDLRVVPDDCAEGIVINGQNLDVRSNPGRCDFTKGFWLNDSVTAPHRVGDRTHYTFYLRNNGGNAGLNVFINQTSFLTRVMNVAALVFFALLCMFVARRFKLRGGILFLFLLGVLIRTVFFANVPYTTYSNDVDGHVAYVQYVLDNHAIPGVDDCWTCYHPPVYYVTAELSFVFGEWAGVSGPDWLAISIMDYDGFAAEAETIGRSLAVEDVFYVVDSEIHLAVAFFDQRPEFLIKLFNVGRFAVQNQFVASCDYLQ